MNDNEKIIFEFINAWSRLDAKELSSYFTENGIYHNIPIEPVTGRKEIEDFINNFSASWTDTNWDILNIVSKNNIVFTERLDRTKAEGGKSVELPCVGIFEMERGKIKIWRDYFDLGTYLKALG
jgi:limonene-1,2-epoxide hydrolase